MFIKEDVGFREIEKFGFYYLQTCYCRDIDEEWIVRLDKKKREIKCWNIKTGKSRNVKPYIKDLIDAGVTTEEIEKVGNESD